MAIYADIIEDDIISYGKSILDILLKDRTTGRNIIWGTKDYEALGIGYEEKSQIRKSLITGVNSNVVQPRVIKKEHKKINRTKDKAEVFTPSWICNEQNNLIDAQWFGRENVFNKTLVEGWETQTEKVVFPDCIGKRWTDYVDARRIEISCGEAPYLCSRYDTVTGDFIDISKRIGLLDRKMRIINENVKNENDWLKWAERAFQSTYGYEFQGDSLLLARENLLYTFIDNLRYKFNREPTENELRRFARIISWNIWQMDGIDCSVPHYYEENSIIQLNLFDLVERKEKVLKTKKYCKIKDWRSNKTLEFLSLIN